MKFTNFLEIIHILFQNTKILFNSQKIIEHHNTTSKLINEILKNKEKHISSIKLDSLIDEYLDYCNYTNEEYYKAGFIDCLNLILPALNIK